MTDAPADAADAAPVPAHPVSLDDLALGLVELRAWAGTPSYARIAQTVQQRRRRRGVPEAEARVARSTVFDCFRPGRRRLDVDLLLEVVAALGAGPAETERWRHAVRRVQQPGSTLPGVQVHSDLPQVELVGRDDELARLLGTTASMLVTGMPGVGKTVLALAAAARIDGHDQTLRVNLDGFGAAGEPVDAAAARDALIEAMSDPASGGSAPGPDRWATYHSLLAGCSVLLVLDNVGSADVLNALLPKAGGPSRAIATSRVRLDDVTTDVPTDATTDVPTGLLDVLELAELGPADSLRLFDGLRGATASADSSGDASADASAARRLANVTGGLPLALTLLAHGAADRPGWSLVDHLDSFERRRDTLQLDDGVHGALADSYTALDDDAQRLLRLQAAAPTVDLDLPGLAALLGADEAEARRVARILGRSHLTRETSGRWELHDLVRVFAQRVALDVDPPRVVQVALDRLARHYVGTAAAAVAVAYPFAADDWAPGVHGAITAGRPAFESHEAAITWLDAELTSLLAIAAWADRTGADDRLEELGAVLAYHLWDRGEMDATLTLHRSALAAAQRLGAPRGIALAHRDLGQSLYRAGRFAAAVPDLERALEIYEELGDQLGVATTRNCRATVRSAVGDVVGSIEDLREVIAYYDRTPGDDRRAGMRSNLGVTYFQAGRPDLARATMEEAAALAAEHGWLRREQWACNNLTELLLDDGEVERGVEVATRALDLARELRDEVGVGYALSNVAATHHARGDTRSAVDLAEQSLQAAVHLGHQALATAVLCELADYLVALGEVGPARARYAEAREVAVRIGEAHYAERAEKALATLS